MIIPDKIMIGAVPFDIKLVPETEMGKEVGIAQPIYQQIRIDKECPLETIETTFCHEILHCLLSQAGQHDNVKDEELFCSGVGNLLHQVITQIVDVNVKDIAMKPIRKDDNRNAETW